MSKSVNLSKNKREDPVNFKSYEKNSKTVRKFSVNLADDCEMVGTPTVTSEGSTYEADPSNPLSVIATQIDEKSGKFAIVIAGGLKKDSSQSSGGSSASGGATIINDDKESLTIEARQDKDVIGTFNMILTGEVTGTNSLWQSKLGLGEKNYKWDFSGTGKYQIKGSFNLFAMTRDGSYGNMDDMVFMCKIKDVQNFKVKMEEEKDSVPNGYAKWGGTDVFGNGCVGEFVTGMFKKESSSDSDLIEISAIIKEDEVKGSVLPCRYILGIISTSHDVDSRLKFGHSWITLTDLKGGDPITYGLWPDSNGWVVNKNEPTSIHANIESTNNIPIESSRYYLLSPGRKIILDQELIQNYTWNAVKNCAWWASRIGNVVVGERLSTGLGGNWPSDLVTSINNAESSEQSSIDNPVFNKTLLNK